MTPNQYFLNAVRETIGLDPLYHVDQRPKPGEHRVIWADVYNSVGSQGMDWESDESLVADDGTRTRTMRERIHAQATRFMRQERRLATKENGA